MLELPNVTIMGITTDEVDQSLNAIEYSCQQVKFGAKKLLCANEANVDYWEYIPPLDYDGYGEFCLYELYKYFDTEFVLITHPDGFVLNTNYWNSSFLEYDYIGAPWWHGDMRFPVGNGGFSIRSKRLCEITATDPVFHDKKGHTGEDHVICRVYGFYLNKKHGIKIAPLSLAEQFSFESGRHSTQTFGFHGRGNLNALYRIGEVPFHEKGPGDWWKRIYWQESSSTA